MKRRNFIKMGGYGGAAVTTATVWGNRASAKTPIAESDLPTFDFATIQVDRWGKEKQRIYRQAHLYHQSLNHNQTLAMVQIPGGKSVMGATVQEKSSSNYERPLHQVKVATFLIGKYPVTQAQWQEVASLPPIKRQLKPKPSHFKGDRRPVECVSWLEAVEFCDRLSEHTGKQYRLPSEAEWEYACRANSKTPFAYGATLTSQLADYASIYAYAAETGVPYRRETTDVGGFMPNAFGVYDLHGNVQEWCADTWHENYRGAPNHGKAWLQGGNQQWRTLRGGSWANTSSQCRSAHRSGYPADSLNRTIGFRVALTL